MQSRSMQNIGILNIGSGAIFIALGGAYFYQYFQTLAAASTSTSTANVLSIYNSMLGMPIIVTLSIFGLGMLIIGGFFIASAHITEHLTGDQSKSSGIAERAPTKMCIKCGSMLYSNVPYCPHCGNPINRPPTATQ